MKRTAAANMLRYVSSFFIMIYFLWFTMFDRCVSEFIHVF